MAYTSRRSGRAPARTLLLAAAAALLAVLAHAQLATAAHRHRHSTRRAGPARGLTRGSYANGAGKLAYELYVPATYRPRRALPLVVALHGCTQTADQFRQLTRFDALAAAKGFIVVFPEQSTSNNAFRCWNWFQDQDTHRGSGEPSLIAGITDRIRQRYTVDAHRIYVTGLSAGGAMAEVMGATYPDLYAAIGVGSGCEYQAGAPCAGYRSEDPEQSGRAAYQAMGSRAREVPFIAFEGDQDYIVPPVNAQQLVRAGQVAADWADDGSENGSVPSAPARSAVAQASAGQSYTTSVYSDGHGNELAELWLVHGMGHAWSGGNPAQQWSDPAGPDETAAIYDFFTSHPAARAAPAPGRH
jgi:poly(hydroxyalkanoate) depolymerase family esterase